MLLPNVITLTTLSTLINQRNIKNYRIRIWFSLSLPPYLETSDIVSQKADLKVTVLELIIL